MRAWLVISLLVWGGCPTEYDGGSRLPPPPLGEEVFTDFYIDNQTAGDVTVRWEIDGDTDSFGPIPPASAQKFATESRFDFAPTPEDELERIEILVDGAAVHRQSPADNSLWTLQQSGPLLDATLVVDSSSLGVDTSLPAGSCCCEFTELDIIMEDLLTTEQCALQTLGQCVVVPLARSTPHPCCPDADGDTCGD